MIDPAQVEDRRVDGAGHCGAVWRSRSRPGQPVTERSPASMRSRPLPSGSPVASTPHGNPRSHPPRRRRQEAQGPRRPGARHQRARARDEGASPTTQLQAKTAEFRQRLDNGEDLDDLLIEAFAVVREAAGRVIGQRHYDVQLMGGAALHFGWVAEMKTGEGKTLVSTLPAYLNGLAGKGVHLVTVNDYLARRDAEWMGQIHRWLGLDGRPGHPRLPGARRREKRAEYALRHHLRHEQRVRLRLPPRQHGHVARPTRCSGATSTPSSTRSTRSSSTRPAPRSSSPAGSPTPPSSTTSSPPIVRGLQRDVDYEVDEEKRTVLPDRGGHREGRAGARRREPLRRGAAEPRPPAPGRAEGQGAVQARQGLHHPGRRGEDRRRVHRPHPRGPALVARASTRRSRPRRG